MRAVCESFHLAKDSGFKVVAHMMPDLPNVGLERDIEQFTVSADPARLPENACASCCYPLCFFLFFCLTFYFVLAYGRLTMLR